MTDHSDLLDTLMTTHDLESLRASALDDFGIDICGVYCLHTGRKVGEFDSFVMQFALEEEASEDAESLVDALIARCIASMRPTPMLNKPDRLTLLNLAEKHPVDILCYLANRLQSNRYLAVNRSSELLQPYVNRIALHRLWTELHLEGVDLRPWIHWLLEIDAKRNLHDVTPLTVALTRTNQWETSYDGAFLLSVVSLSHCDELLAIFEKWAIGLIREYDKRDKVMTAQANWMRGNRLTQPAFTRSWMDNPEIAGKASKPKTRKAAKPKTKKAAAKEAKMNQFLGLLDQVLDGKIAPTPKVAKRKPLTGGMLFKKKES